MPTQHPPATLPLVQPGRNCGSPHPALKSPTQSQPHRGPALCLPGLMVASSTNRARASYRSRCGGPLPAAAACSPAELSCIAARSWLYATTTACGTGGSEQEVSTNPLWHVARGARWACRPAPAAQRTRRCKDGRQSRGTCHRSTPAGGRVCRAAAQMGS